MRSRTGNRCLFTRVRIRRLADLLVRGSQGRRPGCEHTSCRGGDCRRRCLPGPGAMKRVTSGGARLLGDGSLQGAPGPSPPPGIMKAVLALARRAAGLLVTAARWVARVIRRVVTALSDGLLGNERRRFVVGSVVIPLLITAVTVYVGARVVSEYQDWQDRRSRVRDNIESIQTTATLLGRELDGLAQRGGSLEKNRGKGVAGEEGAVKTSLAKIEGMSRLLTKQAESETIPGDHASLPAQLVRCRRVVDEYMRCVVDRLKTDAPAVPDTQCTDAFKAKMAVSGSCRSLEVTAYAIVF